MKLSVASVLLLSVALPAGAAEPIDFRTHVYPILHDRCFRCHQGADAKSRIRLDQRTDVLRYSKPGRPDESLLIAVVESDDPGTKMPRGNMKLTAEQVRTLRVWVEQGVKWDDALLPPDSAKTTHWAFQPVRRPVVPADRTIRRGSWR
jgi:hypothetical protein